MIPNDVAVEKIMSYLSGCLDKSDEIVQKLNLRIKKNEEHAQQLQNQREY